MEDELRRRLGSTFSTDELAALYDEGTSWVSGIAVAAAPDEPFAWDVRVVGDAAFHRYMREAADYAGGRRRDRHPRGASVGGRVAPAWSWPEVAPVGAGPA